jgi:hypothetical protein
MEQCQEREGWKKEEKRAHPHLGPLDLPFVAVTFVSSPLRLQEMKNA